MNRNIKRSVYCQYGQFSLTFPALALRQRERPMLETLDYVLAVHRPFYISIFISTLPTQHTTFICTIYVHFSEMQYRSIRIVN